MNTTAAPDTYLLANTVRLRDGAIGTVFGVGQVWRDDRQVPQWLITTPAGTVRITGNEIYGVEVID